MKKKSIDLSRCHHHAIMSLCDDFVSFRVSLQDFKSFYLACLAYKDKDIIFEKFVKEYRMFFDALPNL